MRNIRILAAVVLMVALLAGAASAGKPHHRGGFFLGFNLGGGTADINVDGVDTDRESGGAANLRLGGAVRNDLLLGVETSGWAKNEGNETVTLSTILFAVTYYPGDLGFFLRGGLGFGGTSVELDLGDDTVQSKDETGFGMMFAMGYEWRLTGKFALGPQVEFNYLDIGGDLVETANFVDATLGFNWYW